MTTRAPTTDARWRPRAGAADRCAAVSATGVTTAPAETAAFAARTLQEGELVILVAHPSAWMFSGRAIGATALAGGAAGALWFFGALSGALGPIVLIWAALVLWSLADWRTRWYILTDRRVIAVRGLVRTSTTEVLLTAVCRVRAVKSRSLGLFGVGTVATFASRDGAEVTWHTVRNPGALRDRIIEVVRRYGRTDARAE